MCGRTVMPGRYQIMQDYNIRNVGKNALTYPYRAEYLPGQQIPAIVLRRNLRLLTSMHWGFGEVYNTRLETVREKSFWAESYQERRMIFPLLAFYERHWFSTEDHVLAAAGIYRMVTKHGQTKLEASMITQPSHGEVEISHPRMPVFIKHHEIDQWLSGAKEIERVVDRELENHIQCLTS